MSKKRKRIPRNEAANNVIGFVNELTHTGDYSGKPFKLRKWQENILRLLFGQLDKNNKRLIRKAFLFLPRGNGKTELCAAIALYCLVCFPSGQQIFSCASDRNQASLIFNAARQMVEANEILSQICEIVPSQKRIVIPEKHSFYCALSADARRQHGLNPSVVLFDELHAQNNADLYDAMQTGLAKRDNPLFISITTAGVYDPNHIAYQEYEYAKRVQDGDIDNPHYLPVLYCADQDDDWTKESTWKKANPALGDFKNIEVLREECKIAQELPSRENAFRQYHLNQWSQQSVKWLSMHKWDACGDQAFDPADLIGKECFAGLDLAPVRDLSSLALLFPFDDGTFKVLSFNWCSQDDILTRSKRDKAPYDQWEKTGFLRTTEGSSTDFDVIRRDINELADLYHIKLIAADQFNAHQLGQQLTEQDGINVQWMRQGFISLGPPTARLEKLVIDEALHHNGNPVLKWCAGNVCTVSDEIGNIKISKKKSTERIDAIAALVNAIGVQMLFEDVETESVYESRGIEFF